MSVGREFLAKSAGPAAVQGTETSYFSRPEAQLDPSIFHGTRMHADVRQWILSTVIGFLSQKYVDPESWVRVWLAGSAASYQWAASREPGDLDVLLGVDYVRFRQANPTFSQLSDSEIARMMNADFHDELQPSISSVEFG